MGLLIWNSLFSSSSSTESFMFHYDERNNWTINKSSTVRESFFLSVAEKRLPVDFSIEMSLIDLIGIV